MPSPPATSSMSAPRKRSTGKPLPSGPRIPIRVALAHVLEEVVRHLARAPDRQLEEARRVGGEGMEKGASPTPSRESITKLPGPEVEAVGQRRVDEADVVEADVRAEVGQCA